MLSSFLLKRGGLSLLREVTANVAAERHGTAAGHAGREVRVFVREVAAGVVADHIKTGIGLLSTSIAFMFSSITIPSIVQRRRPDVLQP